MPTQRTRRTQCATLLEEMAEARGRPRPGVAHADAVADDPDGVHGGERPEDADFETGAVMPGGDSDASNAGGISGNLSNGNGDGNNTTRVGGDNHAGVRG